MRYIMKGGVWKNSEDQILKAAIMKYGLNQWSRISSLLQRKSAKQCKQRWYEWLDPSIKKTEWTRAEDQKLLQLARVFPSQWRTIAPFVGRTPTQCYDRYQKLLDIAQGKNPNDPNDLRKLRPGEIDPNPETKPARPDPIDMDEDEKEMLAEVRVRLANTKGKKAKRKQREKMIDEARRLAQLQKARQLKMAGVENIITQQQLKRLKQKKDIDYNKEVPFKRNVPDFVYKTETTETPASSAFALNISLQTLEGKRRDVEEDLARKMDKRRLQKFKSRDMTALIMQKKDVALPPPVPINLPQPQLGDKDLEQLKKLNITTPLNTQLIGQTPIGMTPENKIMFSARVNLSLNYKDISDGLNDEMDSIQGLKFLKNLQKQSTKKSVEGNYVPISERIKTPVNEWQKSDQGKLQRLFKGLSKPQNIIQFQIPQQQQEQEKQEVMDAQEYERLESIRLQKQKQQRLRNRSTALKKQLPRLKSIPEKIYYYKTNNILQEIEKEYISLVYSDAIDYPIEGLEMPEKQIAYKQEIKEQLLNEASILIKIEQQRSENPYTKELLEQRNLIKKIKYEFDQKTVSVSDQNCQLQNQLGKYKINLNEYKQNHKTAEHTEKKCKFYLAGFEKKIKEKTESINTLLQRYEELKIQRQSIENLREQEKIAMSIRLQELQQYYKLIYQSV